MIKSIAVCWDRAKTGWQRKLFPRLGVVVIYVSFFISFSVSASAQAPQTQKPPANSPLLVGSFTQVMDTLISAGANTVPCLNMMTIGSVYLRIPAVKTRHLIVCVLNDSTKFPMGTPSGAMAMHAIDAATYVCLSYGDRAKSSPELAQYLSPHLKLMR